MWSNMFFIYFSAIFLITALRKRIRFTDMLSNCMKERSHLDVNIHVESVNSFYCVICDYSFEQKSIMNKHIESVHSFDYDIIDYSCEEKSNIKNCVQFYHQGEKPLRCKYPSWISSFIWFWYLWLLLWAKELDEKTYCTSAWRRKAIQIWQTC